MSTPAFPALTSNDTASRAAGIHGRGNTAARAEPLPLSYLYGFSAHTGVEREAQTLACGIWVITMRSSSSWPP